MDSSAFMCVCVYIMFVSSFSYGRALKSWGVSILSRRNTRTSLAAVSLGLAEGRFV